METIKNEWVKTLTQKSKNLLKNLLTILGVISLLYIGYTAEFHYEKLIREKQTPLELKNSSNTSVALNEFNQLIIIDKQTNKYVIYTDTVGKNIFGMYINQIK